MSDVPTKLCGRCREELPVAAFNRMGAGLQHWCRDCFRAYFRERGDVHRRQVARRQRRISEAARAVVVAYLAEHPCRDCGESDPAVLEFDHVRGKTSNVTALGWSETRLERLDAEIAMCEVRCCNCHRRRTAAQRRRRARPATDVDEPPVPSV